tara:strand:+ start:213 stop:896 length:684 start_codon:yes stop_codon:yes gene_type:complete
VENINKIRKLSIWIFIVPFVALNTCLILITNFHQFFNLEHVILPTIPYIDGGVSISRTARVFPTYLIFKPSMFITAFFLIQYWRFNFDLMGKISPNLNYKKIFLFFGIGSAIFLVLHSIFLGIKFDNDFYKFFRRVVVLAFIIFEIIAQTILVINFYKIKEQIKKFINGKILNIKIILVSILVVVAFVSIPFLVAEGHTSFKHSLEWNYFMGVISFYLLTFFFWKKQ